MQVLDLPPQWSRQPCGTVLRGSTRASWPSYRSFPKSLPSQKCSWALLSCAYVARQRKTKIIQAARRRKSDSDSEDKLEKWLPFLAAGVFGLLALTPTLIVGSMAAWWSFAIAATVGSLLYFSVAVPMMITAALVGGIIIPMLAANFLVAGSLIATLLASLATAGAAGLLVWVSLGNPLPMPDLSSSSPFKTKEGWEKDGSVDSIDAGIVPIEDPFTDWDRRFASTPSKSAGPTKEFGPAENGSDGPGTDFEALKRKGVSTYLNVSRADQSQG